MAVALALLGADDPLLPDGEWAIVPLATPHAPDTFSRRQSVPGIGKILRLVRLYESHDIARVPRVQDLVSSCRLVQCAKESAGKRDGTAGAKRGHASLTWAVSEAAVLCLRDTPAGQQALTQLANQQGPGKALPLRAQQLARAVSDMFTRPTAFDLHPFLPA
jgi:hypothetical protein